MKLHIELDPLLDRIRATIKNHEIGTGDYVRYLWQSPQGNRKMGTNEYGCADASNILYMIGDLPRDVEVRKAHIEHLQKFQNPETGMFWEGTHHELHCTAHCVAALELYDAGPKYPMRDMEIFKSKEGLENLLENLDWLHDAWPQAHQGAGVYAAMILTDNADLKWQDWYFDWLDANCDPEYGMSKVGAIQNGDHPKCGHLNGWFHYLFNYNFAHRAFPCVETLIDTVIDLYKNEELDGVFGKLAGFREIDWVFTLNRATMQCGYRRAEAIELMRDMAGKYIANLYATDTETDDAWNDLHFLFGMVCALAELQIALPGEIRTKYPLKQVLDRRPFI